MLQGESGAAWWGVDTEGEVNEGGGGEGGKIGRE